MDELRPNIEEGGLAGVRRPARGLIGWMSPDQVLRFLNGNDGGVESTPEQQQRVAGARQAVADRQSGADQSGVVEPAPPVLAASEELLRRDATASAFFGEGYRVAIADLSRVCAMQPTIFLDSASERVRDLDGTDLVGLAAVTLPTSTPTQLPIAYEPITKVFTLVSRDPNLRVIGQYAGAGVNAPPGLPVIGFFIALARSYMQVVEFQGRYFLRDGYHRALGFLSRGITKVPVFTRTIPSFEELVPQPQTMLPQEAYRGERPPLLPDYLDDMFSAAATLPAQQKVIVIQAVELNPLG